MTLASKPWILDEQIKHIMVEVVDKKREGSFVTAFADAYCKADELNAYILREVAKQMILKYDLEKYLSNYAGATQ